MLDALSGIDPIAFSIPLPAIPFLSYEGGTLPIYWYGILVALGIGVGTWWGSREIEKRGESVDEYFNLLLVTVISGYATARLGYVLLDMLSTGATYTFLEAINIRSGGINILFGFIGGALAGILYIRYIERSVWDYADAVGLTILLAQAIGRWGNFINQELYGPPTELPWGILIDPIHRLPAYQSLGPETRFHPTFLYEFIVLMIGLVALSILANRFRDQWRPGTLFGLFMVWWGVNRAWIELFRPDQATIGETFITYSMIISILIALVGAYMILNVNGVFVSEATSTAQIRRDLSKKRMPKPKRKRSAE